MNWGYICFNGEINLDAGRFKSGQQRIGTCDLINRDFDIIVVDQNGIKKYKPDPSDTIVITMAPGDAVSCQIMGLTTNVTYPVHSMKIKFMDLPEFAQKELDNMTVQEKAAFDNYEQVKIMNKK